jgi:tRNA(Ile)-lysidine synthetase-like protein
VRPIPELEAGYDVTAPGCLQLPHGELRVTPDPGGWRPGGPLTVRFRRGGERLRTGGRHRSLKQLLQASELPPWQRDTLPLIHDAFGLLAVPGVAHRDGGEGAAFRADWIGRGDFL